MTAVLTKSTLESNSYANIYSIFSTRTNIADPRGSSSESQRQMIYDSDPFEKGLNFGNLPYIILPMATVAYTRFSSDGKVKTITWTHRVVVRTVRGGSSGGSTDAGRTDMLAMTDDIHETCNNETIKQQLRDLGMGNLELEKIDSDTGIISQRRIYETVFELSYQERMAVSS